MTPRKKVLVLESEKLLMASVASLLANFSDLSVICSTSDSLGCLTQSTDETSDIIILDEAVLEANLATFITLLTGKPHVRLLVFHLQDDSVQVLDRQQIRISEVDDFLALF